MLIEVEVDGRAHSLRVERAGQPSGRLFEVTIGGCTRFVDIAASPSGWSVLIDGRSYDVAIDETPGGAQVHVDGRRLIVAWPGAAAGGDGDRAGEARGPRRIVAPMPGRVVKVLVANGDRVEARQGLVVVEAMKMENELRAPVAGLVTDVRAVPGALVDANAVLVVIE